MVVWVMWIILPHMSEKEGDNSKSGNIRDGKYLANTAI